jgi:hypothetical protein
MPRRKTIIGISLAISGALVAFGVYLVYLYLNPSLSVYLNPSFSDLLNNLFTGNQNQRLYFAVLFFIMALYPALIFSRSKPTKEYKTVTVVNCYGCDYREIREFQKGDYIFKKLGVCGTCGSERYISAIYSIPTSKVEEKEEAL